MQKDVFTLEGRSVTLYRHEDPRIVFLQPVDEHDEGLLDRQLALMERSLLPFALAAFSIRDWNKELSPWEAPPVFGKQPFGGGGGDPGLSYSTSVARAAGPLRFGKEWRTMSGGLFPGGPLRPVGRHPDSALCRPCGSLPLGVVSRLARLCEG